jgi:signal transduction histidine kinase/CheY-like chemotaxis protein
MNAVVVTPNEADGALATGFLREHGIDAQYCATLADLIPNLGGDTGCVVLVEEALSDPDLDAFHAALRSQPPWSDLPLLLFAAHGSPLIELVQGLFPQSGNVTLLQRPIHPVSLVSAVNVALRARVRQLQVRDLLGQRELAVRQRDEFLAMLAHELRNPLAPIRNAVYLLGTLDIDHPLFLTCRTMIDKQARHITRLVDDLLDASRLELGKVDLQLQRVDLNESVTAAVESCAMAISSQKHRVNVRLPKGSLAVRADPVRLEQAICNLVVNAAKFTPEGGTIDIEVSSEGGFAVFSVTDNGLGIQPDMLESIFDLFTQDSVSLARTKGGLGIGLTLVKRLVELHGGTVKAFSEGEGTGSRFEVRLPLADALADKPALVTAPAAAAPREMRSKRVLVIEDGSETRQSLGMLLGLWKHEVLYAGSGPEGLDRARETRPDIAIIDIGLPGLDGYQVATRIRRDGTAWSRHVRLIALTGYGQAADRARALSAGFDMHVLKPVDPAELRVMLG